MFKLAISKFFEQKLEAPLHNTVWSWGSENAKGIYLRAWNRTKVGDKFDIAGIGMETDDHGRTRAGGLERAKHVKAITQASRVTLSRLMATSMMQANLILLITTIKQCFGLCH